MEITYFLKYKDNKADVFLLKKGNTDIIAKFSKILKDSLDLNKNIYLVPIPSSAFARDERENDQSLAICKEVLEKDFYKSFYNYFFGNKISILNILKFKKYPMSAHLNKNNKEKRNEISKNRFSINVMLLIWHKIFKKKDCVYILFDDVYTTGNTIERAYNLLSKHFKNIKPLVLFH